MQVYRKTYCLRGIRRALKQFNEEELTEWQRDLLKRRLEILKWYDSNGRNQSATALHFETSRPHVASLVKIRGEEGLGGLIPKMPGPKYKRGDQLSHGQRCEIEKYAGLFPDWGHKKLKIFLQPSESTIYRYLARKEQLVRNRCPGYFKKPTPRSGWKIERKKLPKDFGIEKPGDLIVLDSIVEYVGPNFKKLYFVTCEDLATRIGLAIAVSSHSSLPATQLLKAMEYVLQTKIKAVLTDNGSEFLAHFHKACVERGIEHFFTRPRTPKDNAACERFNQTLQRNFYWRTDLTKPIHEINADLTEWLIEYNILRPHETLHMRTPATYYFSKFYTPRFDQGVYLRLWNRT